jgi:hypothetical protein
MKNGVSALNGKQKLKVLKIGGGFKTERRKFNYLMLLLSIRATNDIDIDIDPLIIDTTQIN